MKSINGNASKGIIYYTDNRITNPIRDTVRYFIKKSNLPIVSTSLKPIRFGKNIVLRERKRSYPTYLLQIYTALTNLDTKYVFFCFQGNTHVETISGQKRIEEIEVGELVKTHKGRFRPVTHVFKRYYKSGLPLIEISTKFSSIRCTPEHPFYVYRDRKKIWVAANKLISDDILLYPSLQKKDYIKFNIRLGSSTINGGHHKLDMHIDKLEVDEDLARFMGLYLAEGHYNGKNGIGFTFNNDEIKHHNFISRISYEKFHRRSVKRVQWSTQILININQLGPLFREWFGESASTKKIPEFVFKWNIKNRLSFIKGYLEGDGSKGKCRDGSFYCFNTASKKIADGMIKLMNESGIGWDNLVKVRKQNKYNSKIYFKKKKVYSLYHSRIVFRKLEDLLQSIVINNSYLGIKVENIRFTKMARMAINPRRYVYNLEVMDDNSYIAQSVIVHNCEHDVLYHPSHFDFIPQKDDVFYYNNNIWRWKLHNFKLTRYDGMRPLSCLCVNREFAIDHFKKRIEKAKEMGLSEVRSREPRTGTIWAYEPGTKPTSRGGFSDDKSDNWNSEFPNVDIRHNKTFTSIKLDPKDFKKLPSGYMEINYDEVPGWNLKELFGDGIKNHTMYTFSDFEKA